MDVALLIEEVRVRPPLWDRQQYGYKTHPQLWQQVADVLNVDKDNCKRKWKNLRDAYRALVKQSEQRIAEDKELGIYSPEKDYDSKWVHFAALGFLKKTMCQKRQRLSSEPDHTTNSSYDDDISDAPINSEIKLESTSMGEEDTNKFSIDVDDDDDVEGDDDKWDFDEDMLLDEFHNTPTISQQPLPSHKTTEIRVGNIPIALKRNPDFELLRQIPANISVAILPTNATTENHQQPAPPPPSSIPHQSANNAGAQKNCQCSSSSSAKQVNFLQNLEHEEQQLMQSTREDIKRNTDHTGDPDYNFLVSFLPQMKKMNDLQSLQFRSRMCEMVLNILAPTMSAAMPSQPPPLTAGPGFRLQPIQQQRPAGSAVYHCSGDGRTGRGGNVTINAATSTSCTFIP